MMTFKVKNLKDINPSLNKFVQYMQSLGLCEDDVFYGRLVGCAAIHRLDETCCELKRLYIRPAYRGRGLSRRLLEECIGAAKQIGYRHMRLDTLPFMTAAMGLYKAYGFYEIPPYYDNPIPAVFLQKDL